MTRYNQILKCDICGHEQPDGDDYCESCGARLPAGAEDTEWTPRGVDDLGKVSAAARSLLKDPISTVVFAALVIIAIIGLVRVGPVVLLGVLIYAGIYLIIRHSFRAFRALPEAEVKFKVAGYLVIGAGAICLVAALLSKNGIVAYVGSSLFVLGIILFVAAWMAREHAAKVRRDEALLATAKGMQQVVAPLPPTGDTASSAMVSDLQQLALMAERGLLTDTEYAAAKMRLLGLENGNVQAEEDQ